MDALLKKLNYKSEKNILILNAPESFRGMIHVMQGEHNLFEALQEANAVDFAIIFVSQQEELERIVPVLAEKVLGDRTIWFCYPKMKSKKYVSDINRDRGWDILGKFNFEPVRQVSIDEDWSALRFRNVDFIKKITRKESFALTEKAKTLTSQKDK